MRSLQSELGRAFGIAPGIATKKVKSVGYQAIQRDKEPDKPGRFDMDKWTPPRVERSRKNWAQHDVDMNPFFHGKRKAKRGGASEVNVGMALELAKHTTRENFVNGKGLVRRKCKYSLYVEGLRRGYLQDINQALAWAKAASSHGLHGQCVEE